MTNTFSKLSFYMKMFCEICETLIKRLSLVKPTFAPMIHFVGPSGADHSVRLTAMDCLRRSLRT